MNHTTHTIATLGGFPTGETTDFYSHLAVSPNGDADAVVHASEILRRDHAAGHVTLVAGGADDPNYC